MEASWKEDGAVMRVELEGSGEEGEEKQFGSVKCHVDERFGWLIFFSRICTFYAHSVARGDRLRTKK